MLVDCKNNMVSNVCCRYRLWQEVDGGDEKYTVELSSNAGDMPGLAFGPEVLKVRRQTATPLCHWCMSHAAFYPPALYPQTVNTCNCLFACVISYAGVSGLYP